ncbi:DUF4197 domain-containing protein [Horticoccus sp. 23ND18S-11]|uniref:DUF4197 domain-containing protein n=1 Tax=Horticoccus sp. 23ND18S-11 TaxID=3391832 RepID=UPI0039C90763
MTTRLFVTLVVTVFASTVRGADAPKPVPANAATDAALRSAGLTSAQLLDGLKTGLTALVGAAGTELSKPGAVQVSAPSSMAKLESTLSRLNQSGAFDSFKASLNQAAATVAPQTVAVLKGAIGPLTLADAKTLVGGPADAATQLLRKSADSALRTKLMPLVSQALAANGTAAKAKDLLAKAGPMAAMAGVPSTADLESHLYTQLLDSTFGYLAKQEAAFRANPSQFKNGTAAKVFGLGKK